MTTTRNNIAIFKQICMDMYLASDICVFDNKGNPVLKEEYARVVQMVLRTPYKDLISLDGTALSDIGYIFNITKERVRQELTLAIGSEDKVKVGVRGSVGKVTNPDFGKDIYETSSKKIKHIREIKDILYTLYGKPIDLKK